MNHALEKITKSTSNTIRTHEGNGLAIFMDIADNKLKVKDVRGQTYDLEDLIDNYRKSSKGITIHDVQQETIVFERLFSGTLTLSKVYFEVSGSDNPLLNINIRYGDSEGDASGSLLPDHVVQLEPGTREFLQFQNNGEVHGPATIWLDIAEVISGTAIKLHMSLEYNLNR